MKIRIILFLNILFPLLAGAQAVGENDKSVDTIRYNEKQQYYLLKLEGANQMVYFDSALYDNNRPITILINNNTTDTISITVKSLMSSRRIFKEHSTRYILPGECYSISPVFNPYGSLPDQFFLNDHFLFEYKSGNEEKVCIFRMRGLIKLDSLPDFKEEAVP